MAHFAKIENGVVTQVIVVNNEVLKDKHGVEQELIGVNFCKSLYGQNTQWVQTSYNGSFRGKYAGIGMTYNRTTDVFEVPTEA